MRFLNNTTVTVDAILTKKGRELLAQGTEAFNITKFALADDEWIIIYLMLLILMVQIFLEK